MLLQCSRRCRFSRLADPLLQAKMVSLVVVTVLVFVYNK
jgi:hypothetical protein